MTDPPQALVWLIECIWLITGEKRGTWEVMTKSLNKKKIESMLAFDLGSSSDIDIFEAKLIYEDVKGIYIEKQPTLFGHLAEAFYSWAGAWIAVYDETRKAIDSGLEIEKKKDYLFEIMLQSSKQRKEFEILKSEKDKIMKFRSSLDAKCISLHELHAQITTESSEWKGLVEWQTKLEEIMKKQETLLADSLFSAGIITYFGPFSCFGREKLKERWVKIYQDSGIKTLPNPQLSTFFCNQIQLSEWHQKGLLRDETCIENAAIIQYSERWPIIIDPERVAEKFLSKFKKVKANNIYAHEDLAKEMISVFFLFSFLIGDGNIL